MPLSEWEKGELVSHALLYSYITSSVTYGMSNKGILDDRLK